MSTNPFKGLGAINQLPVDPATYPTMKLNSAGVRSISLGMQYFYNYNGYWPNLGTSMGMAVAHGGSPNVTIYAQSTDLLSKVNDPTTLPASTGYGVAFSKDGTYMAVAHGNSPYVTIYKRNGDTFTKLTNPTTLPVNLSNGVAFIPVI